MVNTEICHSKGFALFCGMDMVKMCAIFTSVKLLMYYHYCILVGMVVYPLLPS